MRYNVLVIDPPWAYDNKKTGGSMKSASNQKYSVMEMEGINKSYKLNIAPLIDDNAIIFCWVTNTMIPHGLALLHTWGYTYKTMITWVKTRCLGMGSWFRGNTEHMLLGVKGNVKAFHCQNKNVIEHRLLRHSQKPEIFMQLIQKAVNTTPDIFGKDVKPSILEIQVKNWPHKKELEQKIMFARTPILGDYHHCMKKVSPV